MPKNKFERLSTKNFFKDLTESFYFMGDTKKAKTKTGKSVAGEVLKDPKMNGMNDFTA